MKSKEEKKGKRTTESRPRLLKFLYSMKRLLVDRRPLEIDEEIQKIKESRAEAREIMEKTKATLNGEDLWFTHKNGREGRDGNGT